MGERGKGNNPVDRAVARAAIGSVKAYIHQDEEEEPSSHPFRALGRNFIASHHAL
jgi:hypothetical protein